ncbi:MAG: fimbrillin family protein [Bacteroidaceae bacterium]|nr:fimbrillin family protein [Bacteroidaceae bacterium]
MKKLNLFATAAIVAMTGCTQSESFDGLLTQDLEISFEAFAGQNNTKVGFEKGKITDPDFEFASVAYYTTEKDAWETEASKVAPDWGDNGYLGTLWLDFDDIKAVKSGDKIISFKSDSKKAYWPKKGYLTFFSWYPSTVPAEMSKGALKIEDYKIVSSADEDLMVADPALDVFRTDADAKYKPSDADYSGVKTIFRHKLTKIGVEAKVKDLGESNIDSFVVKIKKVEIDAVANEGDFQGDPMVYSHDAWTVDTTKRANYNFPMPANDSLVEVSYPYDNDKPYYKSVVKDQIMLLPQTRLEMSHRAILKLTCDLSYYLNGKPIVEEDYVYQTTISDLSWDKTNDEWVENPQKKDGPKYVGWGINKYVIYRLVLGLDEIEWAPEVADWDKPEYVEPIDVQ